MDLSLGTWAEQCLRAAGQGFTGWLDIDRLGAVAAVIALAAGAPAMLHDGPESGGAGARAERGAAASTGVAIRGAESFYGAYSGIPATHPSDVRFRNGPATDLTVHDVNWDGRPFKSPIYYGLRAIRWSGAGPVGAMLDFTHSKAISQREQQVRFSGTRNGKVATGTATVADTFRHLEFSHGHNMLTLNGVARVLRISPGLQPYLGGGLGVSLPHTEIQFADEPLRTYEYQYAGPVAQALGGLEIRLPKVSLFIEYKFTLARNEVPLSGRDSRGWGLGDFPTQLKAWFSGEKPEYGTATTILVSHQMIGGIGVRTGLPGPSLNP